MAYSPTTSWQIDVKTMETVTDFIFLGSKITADGDSSHEIKMESWINSLAVAGKGVILRRRGNHVVFLELRLPSISHEVMGPDAMILVF